MLSIKKYDKSKQRKVKQFYFLLDSDSEDDYPTSLDEDDDNTLKEDDSKKELIIVPTTSTVETHRKIIALSLGLSKRKKEI